jgi:hypothetical protein
MTFCQADDPKCQPIVRRVGEGYLDLGEHAHIAVNDSTVPAVNIVAYFLPPGAPLKNDEPKPSPCHF